MDFSLVGDGLALEEQPGENTEEACCSRWNRAQQTFGVPVSVPPFAGEILEIKMVGEVHALVECACYPVSGGLEKRDGIRDARLGGQLFEMIFFKMDSPHGHEGHQSPIAREQGRAENDEAARAEEAESDAGEEVTEGDAVEHAEQANVGPAMGQPAGVNEGNDKQ